LASPIHHVPSHRQGTPPPDLRIPIPTHPLTSTQTRLAYARAWHLVDIGGDSRALGRVASAIALALMGKHKPIFDPSTDCGDAIDCANVHTTGKKRFQKLYRTHTTRPGSLKEISMDRMIAKWGGGEVLRKAVSGMLPKNRLRKDRLARLKTFEGHAHPYRENLLTVVNGGGQSIVEHEVVRKTLGKARTETVKAEGDVAQV
jgi:large subunit ribosomal protein L13